MVSAPPPPSLPPTDDLQGRLLAHRYRLASPIASGGMAEVWEAVDEILARRVAVKILHRHLAADVTFVNRFRAEAIAAARLGHSSIVSIYDTFSDDGFEAIVMELVRGTTLRARLDQHGPLATSEVLLIAGQVCDALAVAHASGLVHRDVKPANILLSNDGRVLVADFGIAKAAEAADLTRDGIMIGTAKYVAPEQVEGGAIDGRTDLYALGVVLYEALCGRAPFTADTEVATALARLHREPLRPRQIRAGIPRPVEDVVMRAMAREPDRRYPDAASMRAALMAAGDGFERQDAARAEDSNGRAPVSRPLPPEPAPSFARSERGWLVPTALIVLLAVALGVSGLLIGNTTTGQKLFDRVRAVAGGRPARITSQRLASAAAYDPFGNNGRENDRLAPLAIDGDPASAWSTERYNDPALVGVKRGVGLIVSLADPADLRALVVTSPSSGWSAEAYVADGSPPKSFDGWGQPLDPRKDIASGDATFDLKGRKGSLVLIWITHMSPDGTVMIGNAKVTGTRIA